MITRILYLLYLVAETHDVVILKHCLQVKESSLHHNIVEVGTKIQNFFSLNFQSVLKFENFCPQDKKNVKIAN